MLAKYFYVSNHQGKRKAIQHSLPNRLIKRERNLTLKIYISNSIFFVIKRRVSLFLVATKLSKPLEKKIALILWKSKKKSTHIIHRAITNT